MSNIDFELLMEYFSYLEGLLPIGIFLGILAFGSLLASFWLFGYLYDLKQQQASICKSLKRISADVDKQRYPNGVVYIREDDDK